MKMLHTAVVFFLVALVVLYVVLCPRLNHNLYRGLLFHPVQFEDDAETRAPELAGVQGEDVTFRNSSDNILNAWYFQKPHAKYTVIFSHGNGGNRGYRQDTVSMLLDAGTSVLIYDYRGFGESQGLPDVEGICNDAISAYDFLTAKKGVTKDRIILYGESLGCAVTTYLSSQRPAAGLILQSGFSSLNKISTEVFPVLAIYPGKLLADPPLDSLSIVKRSHPPLLIVHGHKDQIVPFAHAALMFQSACEPKRFLELPMSAHNDICQSALPEYSAEIADYLKWLDTGAGRVAATPELPRAAGESDSALNPL